MQKTKFLQYFAILFFLFIFQNASCHAETLGEAINFLYKNNNKLKSEYAKIPESEANLAGNLLNIFPDIRYSKNLAQEITTTMSNGFVNKVKRPKQRRLTLHQDISLANTILSPMSAKVNAKYAKINFQYSEQQILLEAIMVYLSVIEKEEILRVSIENFEIAKKTSELIKKQFELGDTTKTQVQYAMSNLSTRESIKIRAEGDLVSIKAAYKKIFGVEARSLKLPESIPSCVPKKFEKFAKISIQNNLALKSSGAQTDLTRLRVASSVAALMPALSISYQRMRNDINVELIQIPGFAAPIKEEIYQASLNIPILPHGGAEYASIIASKFVYNRALANEKYSYDQVNEEILSNWESVKVSEANLKASGDARDFARNAMNAMRTEYEFGTRSVLELLESEKQYYDASVNFASSTTQKILSYYRVLSTMGNLNRATFI
jgi:outer membrane protein